MTLQNRDSQALRRFTGRVIDLLGATRRPRLLKSRFREVLAGIGSRVGVRHVYLFQLSTREHRTQTVSLTVSATSAESSPAAAAFQRVPLATFSRPIVESLEHKQPVYLPLTQDGSNGARLLTAVLKESGNTGLLLCPVHMDRRLCAVIGLAHDYGSDHIAGESCQQIRLIGQLMVQKLRSMRRSSRQRRRHRQWRRIADAACDFAMLVGEDQRVCQMLPFGTRDLPDISGVMISSLFPERSWRALQRSITRARTERTPVSCEVKVAWNIVQQRWYRVRIQMGQTASQLMLYFTDIDSDRQQQEQLRELEVVLNRTYRLSLLGQVSTEFAHQINQPLQSILNHCGTMQMRLKNNTATKARTGASLSNIVTAVQHASTILQRIRAFVQFKSLSLGPFHLVTLAERAALMVENRALDAGVKLVWEWRQKSPESSSSDLSHLWVNVDEVQTTQVLINLIVNAVEACEGQTVPAPRVDIRIEAGDDRRYVCICVTDNGPGLPEEHPEQVFEKFHTTKAEGLGIGLAVSRSVAEAQNGSLKAQNNPDRGCTFFFTVRRLSSPNSDTDELQTIPMNELPFD